MNCPYCFELKKNCICSWHICAECGKKIPESHAMEYRGRVVCEEHDFEEQVAKREAERHRVMETTNASVISQRNGEFMNNRGKYHTNNVATDGLPIIKIKEPLALKNYERSKE
jgi:hypothetical protein